VDIRKQEEPNPEHYFRHDPYAHGAAARVRCKAIPSRSRAHSSPV
jgi:hypothetical protein